MLRRGALTITTVAMIAGVIRRDNEGELLKAVSGKSQNDTMPCSQSQPCAQTPTQSRRETYYEFTIAADEEFMHMYRRVRSLQSIKAVPGQDIAATFKALMREHIARHAPEEKQERRLKRQEVKLRQYSVREMLEHDAPGQKTPDRDARDRDSSGHKTTERDTPGHETPTVERSEQKRPRPRYIPAATKDRVLARDHYRCTYIGFDGARCRATQYLQFDHVTPFARGGQSTVENLRLLCSAHNRLEARGTFGRAVPTVIREPTPRYCSFPH